jgi:formylglycine-generating enzyme required for sulfatase activity
MPWAAPVEVNFHEARAYAQWRSGREGGAGGGREGGGGAGGRGGPTSTSTSTSCPPYRLLTEAEHHCLRAGEGGGEGGGEDVVLSRSGAELRASMNLNLACGMASPVDAYAPNRKGFRDVRGNVWEW